MQDDLKYIENNIASSIGGGQSSTLNIVVRPKEKETTKAVVSLEIYKWYPIKDIDKAKRLYDAIQRFKFDLDQIVNGK